MWRILNYLQRTLLTDFGTSAINDATTISRLCTKTMFWTLRKVKHSILTHTYYPYQLLVTKAAGTFPSKYAENLRSLHPTVYASMTFAPSHILRQLKTGSCTMAQTRQGSLGTGPYTSTLVCQPSRSILSNARKSILTQPLTTKWQ